MSTNPPAVEGESAYSLHRPGRLISALEACMADRLSPGRSGWSASTHLARDLERFFGIRAPIPVIEAAPRELTKRKRTELKLDDETILWFRLRAREPQ